MAQSPPFKVYDNEGKYEGAVWHAESAAVLVSFLGDGATIRHGHEKRRIVWTEGSEKIPAGESYDTVAFTVKERMDGFALAFAKELRANQLA